MPGGVPGPQGGRALEKLAGKGLEALKALSEKAKVVGEQALKGLEEKAATLARDGRAAVAPELRKTGAVPGAERLFQAGIQEVGAESLRQRLARQYQSSRGLTAEAAKAEAERAVAAAQHQLESVIGAAREQLLGFQHFQGTPHPADKVL